MPNLGGDKDFDSDDSNPFNKPIIRSNYSYEIKDTIIPLKHFCKRLEDRLRYIRKDSSIICPKEFQK